MGIFEGCLLACDIDGTLMENGYINPKNIERIEFFMSQGGIFSISTGRSVCAIGSVIEKLVRISPSVVSNGCMIYDYENQEILHQEILPKEDHIIANDVLLSGIHVGIEVHAGKRVFTLKPTAESDDHQQYEGLETTIVSYDEIKDLDWNKVLFALDSMDDLDDLKKVIFNRENNSLFISTAAFLGGRMRNYYEQLPKGVSKATAIKKLCSLFNVNHSYAIGDYYNDVEMLKNAEICAVPNGSPDDIKAFANYITVDCDDGAVADFIDYLTKIRDESKI